MFQRTTAHCYNQPNCNSFLSCDYVNFKEKEPYKIYVVGGKWNKLQVIEDDRMLVILELGDGQMGVYYSVYYSLYFLEISILKLKTKNQRHYPQTLCLSDSSEIQLLCQIAVKISSHLLSIYIRNLLPFSYTLSVPGTSYQPTPSNVLTFLCLIFSFTK